MTDWQPISTAPKDGTILGYVGTPYQGDEGWVDWYGIIRFNRKTGNWVNQDNGAVFGATHWIPIPPPPQATPA